MEDRRFGSEQDLGDRAMFDLEKNISDWKESAGQHVPAEDLDELESHLRDDVEEALASGMSEEEAFVLANHRLGDIPDIGRELVYESGKPVARPAASDSRRHQRNRTFIGFLLGTAAALLLIFTLRFVEDYHVDEYQAETTFEITPLQVGDIPVFDNQETANIEENFDLATQTEVVTSAEVLKNVVESLNLSTRWKISPFAAKKRLAEGIKIERKGDSRMVRLVVRESDPNIASEVANGIVKSYGNRRREIWERMLSDKLNTLEHTVKVYKEMAEDARIKHLNIAKRYGITPHSSESTHENEKKLAESLRLAREALAGIDPLAKPGTEEGANLEMSELKVKGLQKLLRDARAKVMDDLATSVEYDESEKDYELRRSLYEEMLGTHSRVSIITRMPVTPVVVHGHAVVPAGPVSKAWTYNDVLRMLVENWWSLLLFGIAGALCLRYLPPVFRAQHLATRFANESARDLAA